MNRFAKALTFAALVGLTTSAFSATVVGQWNGHFTAKYAPKPGGPTPPADQVKQINELLNQIKIKLTIKADGTYSAVTTGPKQPEGKSLGKWKLKGKILTLIPDEKGRDTETGNLSANGKMLTMSLPKGMVDRGVTGHAIFSKT